MPSPEFIVFTEIQLKNTESDSSRSLLVTRRHNKVKSQRNQLHCPPALTRGHTRSQEMKTYLCSRFGGIVPVQVLICFIFSLSNLFSRLQFDLSADGENCFIDVGLFFIIFLFLLQNPFEGIKVLFRSCFFFPTKRLKESRAAVQNIINLISPPLPPLSFYNSHYCCIMHLRSGSAPFALKSSLFIHPPRPPPAWLSKVA